MNPLVLIFGMIGAAVGAVVGNRLSENKSLTTDKEADKTVNPADQAITVPTVPGVAKPSKANESVEAEIINSEIDNTIESTDHSAESD